MDYEGALKEWWDKKIQQSRKTIKRPPIAQNLYMVVRVTHKKEKEISGKELHRSRYSMRRPKAKRDAR